MRAEALAGSNEVLVDDSQPAESHELRVVVCIEAEGVVGIEPAVIGVTAFI
jgi:hypothetical protein